MHTTPTQIPKAAVRVLILNLFQAIYIKDFFFNLPYGIPNRIVFGFSLYTNSHWYNVK